MNERPRNDGQVPDGAKKETQDTKTSRRPTGPLIFDRDARRIQRLSKGERIIERLRRYLNGE